MDIQNQALIAEIERFKTESLKTHVVKVWADSYENSDPFGYVIFKNDNNKVWWMKTQAYQLWEMWQAAKAVPEGFVLLPSEPSEAIKVALSYQCFDFIKVAQIYRECGFDIPKKAEDEQSFFLHKFLLLAIKHGGDFIKVFNAETKAMIEAQEQWHENK